MRFFTSFHFVQNDSKLGRFKYRGGVVFLLRRKTTPPRHKSFHEPVIPMRSEESHKINRTTVIFLNLISPVYFFFNLSSTENRPAP